MQPRRYSGISRCSARYYRRNAFAIVSGEGKALGPPLGVAFDKRGALPARCASSRMSHLNL
jgi:hypothetical protein